MDDQVALLRQQIAAAESQLRELRVELNEAEEALAESQSHTDSPPLHTDAPSLDAQSNPETAVHTGADCTPSSQAPALSPRWPLSGEEYKRYGRQMIMSEIGLAGQLRLKSAKVLIIGVGGLGCPAAAYLAGAGIGTLGLVDGDTVELSNLHRQIAHSAARVGMSKVESAYAYLSALNPLPTYTRHAAHLTPQSALSLFANYDLVLDCTDHPTSRYLISDACVLAGKSLISASALKTEGQLIVLNNPPRPPGDPSGGPCYRCIFPRPPPADSVLSCGEGGILGPVVGVMGVLQALEAIKVLTTPTTAPPTAEEAPKSTLLMFSAYSHQPFRSIRMRARHKACAACSATATISPASLKSGLLDYVAFCGATSPVNVLPPEARISTSDFAAQIRDGSSTIVDVRDAVQFALCALPGSLNVPWTGDADAWLADYAARQGTLEAANGGERSVHVVCRSGNDSQLAVKVLLEREGSSAGEKERFRDVKGGFRAWREEVDSAWPEY